MSKTIKEYWPFNIKERNQKIKKELQESIEKGNMIINYLINNLDKWDPETSKIYGRHLDEALIKYKNYSISIYIWRNSNYIALTKNNNLSVEHYCDTIIARRLISIINERRTELKNEFIKDFQ